MIASSCVVLTVFSHGRGSAPGCAGVSDEKRYWKVVSSPAWWRISCTAPDAMACPMPLVIPDVMPSVAPVKRPNFSCTDAESRIFAGFAAPTSTMKYSR